MPLDPIIRLFAAHQRHAWSSGEVDNTIRLLRRVNTWLTDRTPPVELLEATRLDLQEYLNDRMENGRWRGRPLSPNTIIAERRQVRAFYRWAATDFGDGDPFIARNPALALTAPKGVDPEPASTPRITEAQYHSLLAACARRFKGQGRLKDGRSVNARRDMAILSLMWSTGGRRSEIAGLRYGDVDWDAQTVHFARTKARGRSKSRTCYFDDDALKYLRRYIIDERGDVDGPLFATTRYIPGTTQRAPIKPNTITLMLRRRCGEAGLGDDLARFDRFGAHAFRRAYSIDWLEHGGSVRDLETNNGWKHDGRMASHYTREAEIAQAAAEAKRIADSRRQRRHLRAADDAR